ncbi:MAG: glycosyltransferase, partial [Bacteroidales bacterium]|nr:glycosyltransferase [Bacteroidales bacterium]
MATTVSIIIPTKNEEKYLARCLESILGNNFPQERLTIAICDGHSKDHTLAIAQQYREKYDCIKIISNLKQTTAYAINTGIEETQSDIVIIMWAHCFIAEDFIENSVNFLDQHPDISCVGG